MDKRVVPFLILAILGLFAALWGGLMNAVAILLFLGMTADSIRKSLKTG